MSISNTNGDIKSDEYFEKRSLKKGSVGWVLLIGLGVAYVISGDFSGWNYGIAHGGWLGLLIAFVVMGCMYTCTVFGLAELSSAIPTAGAGYGFARCALGKTAGFATGLALTIEYICAPAAISTFIANYLTSLGLFPGVDSFILVVAVYIFFTGIHIFGVGEALKIMFAITTIAVAALLLFAFGTIPSFDVANLFDIPVSGAASASPLFPFGISSIISCLPYGIWFFLGVEGVPLAAEESMDPKRDMPRGLLGAIAILFCTGLLVLVFASGAAGANLIGSSDTPLIDALAAAGHKQLATVLNWAGLAGLIASFFSLMYAGSRQIFALSRAGYLPSFLSLTGSRKTPAAALIFSAIIGLCIVTVMRDGDLILNVAVFGACVSYALMNLSHIVLRKTSPSMHRGYQTPGGSVTTTIGFVLSCIAVVSTFFVDMVAACCVLVVYIVGIIYFSAYAKNHLVANAPEEEFAAMNAAEAELR